MTKELTAAQRNAKREIGKLQRRIKRSQTTNAKRQERIKTLQTKLR
jgi:hypothetical protein